VLDQSTDCFETGASVEFEDGMAVAVPEVGEWVVAYFDVVGDGESVEASIYHAEDDSIVAVYNDEVAGPKAAVDEAVDVEVPAIQPAGDEGLSPGAAAEDAISAFAKDGGDTQWPSYGKQPIIAFDTVSKDKSSNDKCSNDAQYVILPLGALVLNDHYYVDYYYNTSGEPKGYSSSKYRNRMEDAIQAWEYIENSCGIDSALPNLTTFYRGQTHDSPGIDNGVTCATEPDVNTLGWNAAGENGILGATCRWSSTRFSIAFNSSYAWYAGASLSGCSKKYDLGAVAVHEWGHALGLGHYNSFSQVMNAHTGPCQSYDRLLGRGDIRGVKALYGSIRSLSGMPIASPHTSGKSDM